MHGGTAQHDRSWIWRRRPRRLPRAVGIGLIGNAGKCAPPPKMVARRVTTDDHAVLKRFAEANGTAIAEMIAPAVDALIEQAREFCQDLDSQQQDSHARAS